MVLSHTEGHAETTARYTNMEPTEDKAEAYRPRRVLIALDTSPASENALRYACSFVSPGTFVRLVSVVDNPYVPLPLPDRIPLSLDSVRRDLIESGREVFVNNAKANALLTREYRKPFVVPSESDAT